MPTKVKDKNSIVHTPVGCGVKDILLAILMVAMASLVSWLMFSQSSATLNKDDQFSEREFQMCCKGCLRCLSKDNKEDQEHKEDKECMKVSNMFHCATQLTYLFSCRDDAEQNNPCYKDGCHKCVQCLDKTSFHKLEKLDNILWYEQYPDLFRKGNKTSAGEAENSHKPCCKTTIEEKPYTSAETHEGKQWYPVYYKLPWAEAGYYQFHPEVTCSNPPNYSCEAASISFTYLMTTIKPSEKYGHTFSLLYMNHARVKFISFYKPAYCECIN